MRRLEQEMRKQEILKPIMDIRDGASLQSEDLLQLGRKLGNNVVFVDFIYVQLVDDWDLMAVVYREGVICALEKLSVKLSAVDSWVADQLDSLTPLLNRRATQQLLPLYGLVEPLKRFTKPGEVLVLIPTQSLHRVPLHAILVDGEPLIKRNPITYCQSLTLLQHCFNSHWTPSQESSSNVTVISPLEDELKTAESGQAIASLLGISLSSSASTTKQEIIDYMSSASIIHFHGHIQLSENEPLKHHLMLRAQHKTDDDILTADEIFDIRLRKPAHITTIGCSSGRAKISNCDDLLGLTAAFHYAGASSVISALWPIDRDDGSRFSLKFYESWMEQRKEPVLEEQAGSDLINLAVAMQKAVLHVRKDEKGNARVPFHWAGFTLSGSWLVLKEQKSIIVPV